MIEVNKPTGILSKACIPAFDTKLQMIIDPESMLAYIVKHYVTNPKSYFDNYDDKIISYNDDVVTAGDSEAMLIELVQINLTEVIIRTFPKCTDIEIDAALVPINNDTKQTVKKIQIAAKITLEGIDYHINLDTAEHLGATYE